MRNNTKFVTYMIGGTLVLTTVLLSANLASASSPTAASLAQTLSKAGLGCNDLKASTAVVLYGGKRWTCKVKGVKTNLELYTAANMKKAGQYLCKSGFDMATVTNSQGWVITSGNASIDSALAKALTFSIKKTCKY
jgi:hypothetical protein